MKTIKPRWQEIKFNRSGDAYVTFYNRRHKLSDFMRLDEPQSFYNANHKGKAAIVANGYKTVSNSCALLIEINNSSDAAKICFLV